ncbi:MAG: signal recognition particle-docking protein FtsY [Desulfovibrio sp.]|uniref:signal recognition particle-docking protein FtsY n=1 Tax=Desulfovibrio sp. 7SRBS1 TaxID=3378064 RepID=UPI003B3D1D5F
MGFFSKIKKLWDVDSRLDNAVDEYKKEQGIPEAPSPQTAKQEFHQELPETETIETPPVSDPVPSAPAEPQIQDVAEKPASHVSEQGTGEMPPWQTSLLLSLREAEPRLSVWLNLILEGISKADDVLWERLAFLMHALEVPQTEADDFIIRFQAWLDDMEYEAVEEFRSELQYRLALALDLEDEEDERSRLFLKLSEGLEKTRETITRRIESLLTSHDSINNAFWEELEEILIMADVGFEPSMKLVENLKERVRKSGSDDPSCFKELLHEELADLFKGKRRISAVNPPEVIMMVGVNGVGKTTTIAKLAHRAQMQGRKVLIAAGDTFRAAAIEQLEVWAKRVGTGFYAKGENSDPAAVAYEAIEYAKQNGYDLVLLDTAGRLHTKVNLMEELKKIRRVAGKQHEGAPHRCVLVVDATTGQNAISQTKLFDEAVGVDEIVLTKLDGTAKGGIVVAIALEFGIPITFVGLGEKMEDLRPFDGGDFAQALLS